jgi:hypothetical protein
MLKMKVQIPPASSKELEHRCRLVIEEWCRAKGTQRSSLTASPGTEVRFMYPVGNSDEVTFWAEYASEDEGHTERRKVYPEVDRS